MALADRLADRGAPLLVAALVPAAFVAFDPAGWYPFGPAKWLAVSSLIPAGVAALIWRDRGLRFSRPVATASVALVLVMAVAAAIGLEDRYAWLGTPERHFGVAAWLLCALALWSGVALDPERDAPVVVRGAVVAGLVVGAVAVAEALGIDARWLGVGDDRLTATFGSPAYLGAAAVVVLPVGLGVALSTAWPRAWRMAGAVAAAAMAVALLGSGSRGAWLGTVAALIVVAVGTGGGAVDRVVHRLRGGSAVQRWGTIIAVVAILSSAVLGAVAATPVGDRIGALSDPEAPGGVARLDEWRVATRVIADDPLLGVGPEGYRLAFGGSVDDAYEIRHGRTPLPDRAHSGPLDVAATGGVVGLGAWLAVWAIVGRSVLRVLRRARRSGAGEARSAAHLEPWTVGVAAAVVGHWIGQLVLFPTSELEPVVWLLGGVLVAATARSGEMRMVSIGRAGAAVTAGVLGLVAATTVVVGTSDLVADRDARRAADALAAGDAGRALDHARRAADRRTDVVRYHLLVARTEVAADEGILAALASADRALEVSPRDPVARRERVRLLALRAEATQVPGHAEEAVAAAQDLVAGDPSGVDAWLLLAEAQRLSGQADEARAALACAAHLAPDDPRVEVVGQLLDETG